MIKVSWSGEAGREVASIVLDRPDKRNAMTPEMLERFCAAVQETRNRARAVIIRGEGDVFCSGFDLAMCLRDQNVLVALLRGLSRAIIALRELPAPVVAAVQGAAIAGGCALLCGADVVVTHEEAKLGYPVVRLGISPGVNAPFLMRSMGGGATRARLLDTQLISGADAMRLGLAHECLACAADVTQRATTIASELAQKPAPALAATKRWLDELDELSDPLWVERALNASLELVGSVEERERLAHFLAKS